MRARILEHKGLSLTIKEWSNRLGLTTDSLKSRLKRDWSVEQTLTIPARGKREKKEKRNGDYYFLHRFEYGPAGFTCPCGESKFVSIPKRVLVIGNVLTRPEYHCKNCLKKYIFVNEIS